MKRLLVALAIPAALGLGVGSVAASAAKAAPTRVVTHQVTAAANHAVAGSAHKAAVVPKAKAQPKAVAQPPGYAAEADVPGGHEDPDGVDTNHEATGEE